MSTTTTPEEIAYRKSMSISRIRKVITFRDWVTHAFMVSEIRYGYNCTLEQADALLDLGVMNGYIEVNKTPGQMETTTLDYHVKAWNKYRIKES